jgi:ABC-2 type transport system permease protein
MTAITPRIPPVTQGSASFGATVGTGPSPTVAPRPVRAAALEHIPLSRIVSVELRKSFDTRSGFWLLASIGIASLLATIGVILFAAAEERTFSTFTLATGFPMAIILPVIAILSVTSEWSQRSGLTTFTLVPNRGRVILAKGIAVVLVAIASMLLAFAIGAVGKLVGFMLGLLIRNSAGAMVAYFVFGFVAPPLLELLAFTQDWFRDTHPWVDPNVTQKLLFQGPLAGEQWSQLGVTTVVWLIVPISVGLWTVLRAEVK